MIVFAGCQLALPGVASPFSKGEEEVRHDFRPVAVGVNATPHLHPLPFVGER
jgi:hypothetical protein